MTTVENLPGDLDIITYQGDDFNVVLRFQDEARNPLDLVGYVFTGHIRANVVDMQAPIIATMQCVVSGDPGELVVSIPAATMETLSGVKRYDIQSVATNGDIKTWLAGKFTVKQEVTRP